MVIVAGALCLLAACAVGWTFAHGYILYYGDAQSHLNLSRSIVDSRTPGYDQLGTVWLPVLHVICLPFVIRGTMWATGLAGSIPVAVCFVVAGLFFYLAAREAYANSLAAAVVVACFALNPNILYLSAIPMTEMVFLAGFAVLLFALSRYRAKQSPSFLAIGVLASWWMSLTRYDGWFLIPFSALAFAVLAKSRRWIVFIAVAGAASIAPLFWLAHNWWESGNALDFYNGPYSALAIQGGRPYPGYSNWPVAVEYYAMAGLLCAGWSLFALGIAGMICAIKKRAVTPVWLLTLTPVFYIWSIHSSGNPIFLPQLPSHGYYNSRYGIAVVALAAFSAGAIAFSLPARWNKLALLLPVISILPWVLQPSSEHWICWKESQVNSDARRAWTAAGVRFLSAHYRPGQGILTPSASGDIAGIFCRARIPLCDTVNIGNGPAWLANTLRPDLVHQADWAVAQAGDVVTNAITRRGNNVYSRVYEIQVKGAPALEVYRRK